MNLTVEEFYYFANIAQKLFNYMNGRVNRVLCTLDIKARDLERGALANIVFPNYVSVYLDSISMNYTISNLDEVLEFEDYMISTIAWSLCHELHHADQLMSVMQYVNNEEYKQNVEMAVELNSYNWVCNHINELSNVVGYRFSIEDIGSELLDDARRHSISYKHANAKDYYLQVIYNTIFRNLDMIYDDALKLLIDDKLADDIILEFSHNDSDKVCIKKDGVYLLENISTFAALAYKFAGQYDKYQIEAVIDDYTSNTGKKLSTIKFILDNKEMNPIYFDRGKEN